MTCLLRSWGIQFIQPSLLGGYDLGSILTQLYIGTENVHTINLLAVLFTNNHNVESTCSVLSEHDSFALWTKWNTFIKISKY